MNDPLRMMRPDHIWHGEHDGLMDRQAGQKDAWLDWNKDVTQTSYLESHIELMFRVACKLNSYFSEIIIVICLFLGSSWAN